MSGTLHTEISFSIVTPSLNADDILKRCIDSVKDQEGVTAEHIIQDGGSTDGTLNWLASDDGVKVFVESDSGMYEAINRGLARAQGEFAAHLNADEQYLPGALQTVGRYFQLHPEVDVIFADTVIIDESGCFLSFRKAVAPSLYHILLSHLNTFTCSTFFRISAIVNYELRFDESYRTAADVCWVREILEKRVPFAVFNHCTTAFTDTGENLSLKDVGRRESLKLRRLAPFWARVMRPFIISWHRLKKWKNGAYRVGPFDYEIYTPDSLDRRRRFSVARPSGIWASRL